MPPGDSFPCYLMNCDPRSASFAATCACWRTGPLRCQTSNEPRSPLHSGPPITPPILLDQASRLAQLRHGDTRFDLVRIDLMKVLSAAIQSVAAAPDLTITCDARDLTGTEVNADRNQLREALTSLIAVVGARPRLRLGTDHGQCSTRDIRSDRGLVAADRSRECEPVTRSKEPSTPPAAVWVSICRLRRRSSRRTEGASRNCLDAGRCVGMVVWLPVAS